MTSLITKIIFYVSAIVICAFIALVFAVSINTAAGWIIFGIGIIWFLLPSMTENLTTSLPLFNNLKTISGRASNIVHSIENFGADGSVNTYQVISFDIDGFQATSLRQPGPIFVYENSHVVVSGLLKHGILHGLAYKNHDRNITGRQPAFLYLVFGTLIAIAGLSLLTMDGLKSTAYIVLLVSAWFYYQWATVKNAANNVKKWMN